MEIVVMVLVMVTDSRADKVTSDNSDGDNSEN